MVKKIQYDLQWRWCFSLIKTSLSLSYTNSTYFIQHFVIRILCFSYLQSIISGSFCMFRFYTFVHLVYGKWKKKSLIIKTSARQKSFACSASIACDACDQVKMSLFDRSLSSCTPLITRSSSSASAVTRLALPLSFIFLQN